MQGAFELAWLARGRRACGFRERAHAKRGQDVHCADQLYRSTCGSAWDGGVRAEAAARPRRLAGAVESVESVESVIGAGRPEGERSQSAGATEVASARGAELTTYHNLGYAVIFDGPRAARSQPASATMARAAKDSRGQGWHSGRACIHFVAGPPPRQWRTPLASQARTADGSRTCAKRQASPRVQAPV